MGIKDYIEKCLAQAHLTVEEASSALELIMTNQATESQIAGLLIALRAKGESVDEVVGFARTMREKSVKVRIDDPDAIDMCGTGGDGLGTLNISTLAAIVAAGAGVTVAKHGNRSVSSRSGSADVLSALGVKVQVTPEKAQDCINKVGIGFLFAPLFHPAMKSAAKPRSELGVRTIFNMVGPLTNPGGVRRQVVGTYSRSVARTITGALTKLDAGKACVVHSADGMDEVTLSGETWVSEVQRDKPVRQYSVYPDHFGFSTRPLQAVQGGDAMENAGSARQILQKESHPARDFVVANAALGIYVAGKAATLKEGVARAAESIDSGRACDVLNNLVEYTNQP